MSTLTADAIDFAACDKAQEAFCKSKGWPHFAPRRCYNCRGEIYSHPQTAAESATHLITGCRLCYYSFVD